MRLLILLFLSVQLYGATIEPVGLGVVFKDEDVALDIVFVNKTPKPTVISQVTSSCDCLKLLAEPGLVASNETKVLPFSYRSAAVGRVAVTVQVMSGQAAEPLITYVVAGYVAEKDWIVSAGQILTNKETEVVVVDVREPDKFSQDHLPRALNIPAFALRGRTELRSKRVVLMDEGASPDRLLEKVKELRDRGFAQVSMLRGGLVAWKQQGGATTGTAASEKLPVQLLPAEFMHAQSVSRCRVIELLAVVPPALDAWPFPVASVKDIRTVLADLEAISSGVETVLIIAPDIQTAARIEAGRSKKSSVPVFYLKGGRTALAEFINQQKSLKMSGQEVTQMRPSTRHSRAAVPGCGTCGKH